MRHPTRLTLLALLLFAVASAGCRPPRLFVEDITYLGAFGLSSADFGGSSVNYAVGRLAYNPDNDSLFIAGHTHHNAIAEFPIPQILQAATVAELDHADAPIQPFEAVLDAPANGNPEANDRITGMLYVDGQLIVNAEQWYDAAADNVDTTLVVHDAADLAGSAIDGYFELGGAAHAGGYLAAIPPGWQPLLGGAYLSGWSSVYSIISRYSVGPSLFVFDAAPILNAAPGAHGPVATTPRMNFGYDAGVYLDPDALVTQPGSASPLWNFLSKGVYGFVVPGTRTFAVFGSTGGVASGIGYKITQSDGNLCGGYCAYDADDHTNQYWLFDLDEILAAGAVHDPQPYAYGGWSLPFDANGAHPVIGGTFDPATATLYLALANAGQLGTYDRPPLILAFEVAK